MARLLSGGALLWALLLPGALSAQGVDLSGDWVLSVDVNGSVTTPSLTLVQEADSLSGSYRSETLGTANIRGTVEGGEFTFRFNASMQGQPIPVRYEGEVQEDGTLAGTIELADGAISGTFTGKRADAVARPRTIERE